MTQTQKTLLATNIAIVIGFGSYFLHQLNYEFFAYALTIAIVTAVLLGTLRWSRFPSYIIAGVTFWGLLHMLGGSVTTADGNVLYAAHLIPIFDGGGEFFILKYDQVVHAFLYGIVGLMFLHIMETRLRLPRHNALVSFIAIFAAAGFGILNEIVEFLAAVNLPETGVGGYHNTVLDLIFNLSGAAVAVVLFQIHRKIELE